MPILVISSLVLLGQLATRTSLYFALLSTLATLFGLMAVSEAGGIKSAVGCLNAVLTVKFLLIAFALKIVTLQPADLNLRAPRATALVMAIGFLGLLIGTWIHRRLPVPAMAFVPGVNGATMYLALTIVLGVASYIGFFIGLAPDLSGAGVQTGGILGIARNVSLFRSLPIVAALYFAWARGNRFLSHPLVLSVLIISMVFGIFSTGKQDALEPLLFYVAVGVSRYGLADKRLWLLTVSGVAYYALLIYPYSQYVRSNGGREGNLASRVTVMGQVLWLELTDSNFREYTKNEIDSHDVVYLGSESLEPFSRLAMIGEADKLVAGTDEKSFTGWETINWGFSLISPSFLFPDKQIVPAGNYLGHITGEAAPGDQLTQFSYGIMANFYNAFSYQGVLLGSTVFFCLFYYYIRFWFGDPRWISTPKGSTIWFLMLVGVYQHGLVEESFSGILSRMAMPLILLALYQVAKYLCMFLPKFDQNEQIPPVPFLPQFLQRKPLSSVELWSLASETGGNPRLPDDEV